MRRAAVLALVLWGNVPGWAAQGATEVPAELQPAFDRAAARQAAAKARGWQDPPEVAEIRAIESSLVGLLQKAPENAALREQLGRFYADWPQLGEPSPGLLALVASAPDPVELVRRLHGDQGASPLMVRIDLAALAVRPGEPVLWKLAADSAAAPEWRAALLEEAFRTAQGRDAGELALLAAEWLDTELAAGLPAEALATFRGLPPAVRTRLLAGPFPEAQTDLAGRPLRRKLSDPRLELAIAQILAGEAREAAALNRMLPPLPAEPARGWLTRREGGIPSEWRARRLVDRWLRPAADDPFELLTEPSAALRSWADLDWFLLLRKVAEREGYPAIASHAAFRAALRMSLGSGGPMEAFAAAPGLPPRVLAMVRRLAAAREALYRELAGPVPARAAQPPAGFKEEPWPEGTPVRESEGIGQRMEGLDREGWPRWFRKLRIERDGERAAALGLFDDYDPRYLDSIGGYWVILSKDRGRSWSRPLYTGLTSRAPYWVPGSSVLPLLAGERLQVEASVDEPDPRRMAPPAVFGKPVTREKPVVLSILLADLQRDTDGDGLTDLAEQRLGTDPADPNTDHDGLPDGVDPMPGVSGLPGDAGASESADLAGLLAAVRAQVPAGEREGPSVGDATDFFLVSDPALFAAWPADRRTMVLTPQQAAAGGSMRGLRFTVALFLFLDRSRQRAFLLWEKPFEGGVVHFERSGGGWKSETFGDWTVAAPQSSAGSPEGAILTSLGSNRARTSTRSDWAFMTW